MVQDDIRSKIFVSGCIKSHKLSNIQNRIQNIKTANMKYTTAITYDTRMRTLWVFSYPAISIIGSITVISSLSMAVSIRLKMHPSNATNDANNASKSTLTLIKVCNVPYDTRSAQYIGMLRWKDLKNAPSVLSANPHFRSCATNQSTNFVRHSFGTIWMTYLQWPLFYDGETSRSSLRSVATKKLRDFAAT